MANKLWIPEPFYGIDTSLVSCKMPPFQDKKMHLLIHPCGFLVFPCFLESHVFLMIKESFPRLPTPGSGKHSCFHISLRKNEETPFLKGEEMLPHLLWSLLYKPKLQTY